MPRPEKMYRVRIFGMKRNREEVMQTLQKKGALHVRESETTLPDSAFGEEREIIHEAVKNTEKIARMKEAFFPEREGTLRRLFEEKHERVSIGGYTDDAFRFWSDKCVSRILDEFEKIASEERKFLLQKEGAEKMKCVLSKFEKSSINLGSLGEGKYTVSGIGKIKNSSETPPEGVLVEEITSTKDGETYVFFSAPKEKMRDLQKYVAVFDITAKCRVHDAIIAEEKKIESARAMLLEIAGKKREFEKNKPLLLAIEERWNNIKSREAACRDMRETKSTFLLEGWVPESALVSVTSMKNAVVYADEEKEFAPTLLNNSEIIKPYELLTKTYSLPAYGGIDPTLFVALSFTIFFGFMFMDIAYSAMVIPLAALMVKKGTRSTKDMGRILLLGSVSGILFGALGGSVLGNFITFNSYLDAYKRPFELILYSLLLGLMHVNLGIATKYFESKRIKDEPGKKDALSWISFQAGVASSILAAATHERALALPAILLIGWTLKVRLKDGFAGALGVVDFFGNMLSYIRLMALAIITSWFAYIINMVAGFISGASLWLGAAFFIAGHMVNLAFNIISSSLHALRLNYVEFFGTFYDGGGTEYRPLVMRNEYHKTL